MPNSERESRIEMNDAKQPQRGKPIFDQDDNHIVGYEATRPLAGEAAQPRFVDGKCRYCGEPEGQHLPDMCGYDKCKGQSCDKWILRPQNPHQLCDECLLKYIASLEARLTPPVASVDDKQLWNWANELADNDGYTVDNLIDMGKRVRKAAALSPAQAAQPVPVAPFSCIFCRESIPYPYPANWQSPCNSPKNVFPVDSMGIRRHIWPAFGNEKLYASERPLSRCGMCLSQDICECDRNIARAAAPEPVAEPQVTDPQNVCECGHHARNHKDYIGKCGMCFCPESKTPYQTGKVG